MSSPGPLYLHVIYDAPPDYPGAVVVWRFTCAFGSLSLRTARRDDAPLAIVQTLDQARAVLPPGSLNLGRFGDDPTIREVWM